MAKIYVSYHREDLQFVLELASRLKTAGHTLSYDVDELSPGTDWRKALDIGLKSSEIFIVVISQSTHKSQSVLTEVGAARAYAFESNRMLLVPLVIDGSQIPLSIQDIHAIIQPDRNLDEILPKVERAISAFIGRRAAIESAATEAVAKIQTNATNYISVAICSLEKLEVRDRVLSYLWYFMGFASLLIGIWFAFRGIANAGQHPFVKSEHLVLVVLKAAVVIGLLGACAKYAFSLGKSYSSESLKSSDRIHAIRFGEFYLGAFGEKTKWDELKEVFQHWNIDRNSSFSSLDVSNFDPKIIESLMNLINTVSGRKDSK
jgi:hypothetical protein